MQKDFVLAIILINFQYITPAHQTFTYAFLSFQCYFFIAWMGQHKHYTLNAIKLNVSSFDEWACV